MRIANLTVGLLLVTAGGSSDRLVARGQPDMLQVHIGHVVDGFKDTPKQQGLLLVAVQEAKIAIQHAALAAKMPDNLDSMKLHAGHVIHTIDPSVEVKGPGLGYGVKKAAAGVAQHAELAAKAPSATANAKNQALYVVRAANNVAKWADDVVLVAQEIRTATTAAAAAKLLADLTTLTEQFIDGVPAVGRFDAQGGLNQAQERMELMKKG